MSMYGCMYSYVCKVLLDARNLRLFYVSRVVDVYKANPSKTKRKGLSRLLLVFTA